MDSESSDDPQLIGRSVKTIARALVDGWDMPNEVRAGCVRRMAEVVRAKGKYKPREVNAAVRALISMDKLRLEGMKVVGEQMQVGTLTDPEEARRAMREDPEYIEYLRRKAVEQDEDGAETNGSR